MSSCQYFIIGKCSGSAPNRPWVITWDNNDYFRSRLVTIVYLIHTNPMLKIMKPGLFSGGNWKKCFISSSTWANRRRSAYIWKVEFKLEWRHNGRDGVSNHQPQHCLFNTLFRRRSNKASNPRVPGLCAGNSPVTGEFPAQMASNAKNVSIWWRHHEIQVHYPPFQWGITVAE